MGKMLALANALYRDERECTLDGASIVGGHLHILLDDGNVSDSDVTFCLENARADGCETCTELAMGLMSLSEDQRYEIHEKSSPFERDMVQ